MNILITGVHGFVGSNLVKYLSKENTIYGLDIVQPEKEGVKCTFSWDALDNPSCMPEIDAIIHLAGKAHDTRNKSAADVYFKVNTGLTQRIFDWYMASPSAKKFIFFSTAKAAAECVPEILYEDVEPTPKGPYGESKIKAEDYIIDALFFSILRHILQDQGISVSLFHIGYQDVIVSTDSGLFQYIKFYRFFALRAKCDLFKFTHSDSFFFSLFLRSRYPCRIRVAAIIST